MLWHVAGHPISCALQNKQIEDTVVNRCSSLGHLAQFEIAEALCELGDEGRLCHVIIEPCLKVQKVSGTGGFDRARIAIVEDRGPIPVPKLTTGVQLPWGWQCLAVSTQRGKYRQD